MKKPSTLLRSLSSRLSSQFAASPVAPWPPVRSAFDRWLASELNELCADPLAPCTSAAWLGRALDLAVAAQKRLIMAVASAEPERGMDRKTVDECVDDTTELLDACAGLRERLDVLKNYVASMHIALHWLESGDGSETATRRARAALAACEAVERGCGAELAKCGSNLRKLGEKVVKQCNNSNNEQCDEALSGARAVALLAIGALGAALAFRPRRALPGVSQPGKGAGSSWESALQEVQKHVKEEYERRRKEGVACMAELDAVAAAGQRLKNAVAGHRHWPEMTAARRRFEELEMKVVGFQEKVAELHGQLIGVRMVLLEWSHRARGHEVLKL